MTCMRAITFSIYKSDMVVTPLPPHSCTPTPAWLALPLQGESEDWESAEAGGNSVCVCDLRVTRLSTE